MSDSKKLIIVLGAHRSGTSLCTAAIESLGADACLGKHYSNEENSKGFFEHPDVVDFNNSLLAHLGGSWDNPLFDGAQALSVTPAEQQMGEAVLLLQNIYGDSPVAVLKDPRVCQLLPFWREAISRAGYLDQNVFYVHTLRDPVEVAMSQKSRAESNPVFYEIGRELGEGAALWLSLTFQAISHAPGAHYLSYQSLLDSPARVLEGLARFLQLKPNEANVAAFCDRFVDRSLHRSSGDEASRAELASEFPQVLEFYARLSFPSDDPGAVTQAELASCAIARRPDTRERMAEIAIPALSRLSNRSRLDRLRLEHAQEVSEDLKRQTLELKDNTKKMRVDHEAVVTPLREQVDSLQSGNQQLQSQLAEQGQELERVGDIAEKNHLAVIELAEQKSTLESEKVQLEGERSSLEEQCGSLDRQIVELDKQRTELIDHVAQMENSTSWKLTRPLRSISFRLQRLRGWLGSQWVQFRLTAILVYHRMSLRHPALAWFIRRLVRPLFRFFNRVFSVGPKEKFTSTEAGLLTPMLYQQEEPSDSFTPMVSVIVPNYNHARYLTLRLESIFSQTYKNFEVILLDDASSDDSAEVLRDFHERYPEQSTLLINDENSGGVFHQWERGLNLARGEIVWIAESDDWCTENFLEALVPYFENEAIQLAYSRTVFMDGEGEQQIWSINEYLHDIDPQRWNHPIIETGPAIVREAFAVKNIVPNVSSALFRTPRHLEILQDPEWRAMRTCGDWVLYLHLLRGGMMAYSPAACNYYRIHGENTSVDSYKQDQFYREHEVVAQTVQKHFEVPEEVFEQLRNNLEIHWRETRGEYTDEALERCYSLDRIRESREQRIPNLLMASYAFCAGGGETFPVSLANIMKAYGYNVTYLDCAREPRQQGVRQRLRQDIPIVSDFTQLERIINDFEIDVVHSHHAWMDSTILDILPEDVDCKTVVTLHGMYETINEYELRPILPRLVKRSAKLIYVAEKNLEAIEQHGLLQYARTTCIDNALEADSYEEISRESLGIAEDAFVLTLVSRGMVEKGWEEGIAAVTAARQSSGFDIQLLLVGDGPEYDRLSGLELPPFIHLEGFQRNVRGYFAVGDLGFLPSKFRGESFPLVIIECLQTGRPFLATDLGEISRMLAGGQDSAGAVVPLDGDEIDMSALESAIVDIAAKGSAYRKMCAAVPAAAAKFDPAILARKHDEAYRQALEVCQ